MYNALKIHNKTKRLPLQHGKIIKSNIDILIRVIIRNKSRFLFHHKSLAGTLQRRLKSTIFHNPTNQFHKFKSTNIKLNKNNKFPKKRAFQEDTSRTHQK